MGSQRRNKNFKYGPKILIAHIKIKKVRQILNRDVWNVWRGI